MIGYLKFLFVGIFVGIVSMTYWASRHYGVGEAYIKLWTDPWGRATLFDAYFAFLTFYVWVFYKERLWSLRLIWFILIMGLGNISMSLYVLIQLFRLKPGEGMTELLTKRKESHG